MSWAVISRYLCRRLPGGVLPPAATSTVEGRGAEVRRGGSGLLPSEGKLSTVGTTALLILPAQVARPPTVGAATSVEGAMGGDNAQPATWLA